MICEKCLRDELKRLPRIIKNAIKEGRLTEALEATQELNTLEWVLSDDDCKK